MVETGRLVYCIDDSEQADLRSSYLRVFAASLLVAALLSSAAAQLPQPPALRSWSRSASQDSAGFYFQPEILGEDYPTATAAQIESDIAVARRVGARALRFGVSWLETEPKPGIYAWSKLDTIIHTAQKLSMPVLPYLCYTPQWASSNPDAPDFWAWPPRNKESFAKFAAAAAARYRGKVLAWGIWNEPDGQYWKGSPDDFAALLREASAAIRSADPAAGIWLGGMADGADDFFRSVIERDRADKSVNAVGLHGYPETWDARSTSQYYAQEMDEARDVLDAAQASVDVWADENGYSDFRYSARSASPDINVPVRHSYEHTAAYQAVALWRAHIAVLASGEASLMGWYRIHDLASGTRTIGDQNNRFLGILDARGREKPAFAALRFYDRLFDQPTRSLDPQVTIQTDSKEAVVHVFKKRNGDVVVSGWMSPDAKRSSTSQVEVKFPPGYAFTRMRAYKATGELISDRRLPRSTSPFVLRRVALDQRSATILLLSR